MSSTKFGGASQDSIASLFRLIWLLTIHKACYLLCEPRILLVSKSRRRALTTAHSIILIINMMILTDLERSRKETPVLNLLICRLMTLAGKQVHFLI